MEDVNKADGSGIFIEEGVTGLNRFSGIINEEFLPQLKGRRGIKIYKEMAANDPVIGGILFATEMMLRNIEWRTEPAKHDDHVKAAEVAEFVESVRTGMAQTWSDFIAEALSMLTFGWAAHEIVYKRREDGLIGWDKLPIRSQDTLQDWVFADNGDIEAMRQNAPNDGTLRTIPIQKLLLFRTTSVKNNPEGRSALRNAYRPWFFKKRIEEIEGVGIERDLAGLPVAYVPAALMSKNATVDEKSTLATIKQIITNIRRDEQEGVVFPMIFDKDKNQMYKLELLTTGGKRNFDTNKIISRYDKRIAMTILADFIMLGHDNVGSFALSSDKTALFATALGAWVQSIVETLNRKAIPAIIKLNGVPEEFTPEFAVDDIEKVDIEKWTEAVSKLQAAGVLVPDDSLEAKARDLLDIPSVDIEADDTGAT